MINIEHPKVSAKPPINKLSGVKKTPRKGKTTPRNAPKGVKGKLHKNEGKNCLDCSQDDLKSQFIDSGVKKKGIDRSPDCNQNVIDPDSCSFEQICSMIDDLEKNLCQEREVLPVQTAFIPVQEASVSARVNVPDQVLPERDESHDTRPPSRSTYDDIMSFLGTLEHDCVIPKNYGNDRTIQELFNESQIISERTILRNRDDAKILPEVVREELATTLLKLEDREETIKVLKEELRGERKIACEKLDQDKKAHAEQIQTQKTKYQNVIKRHQKFIEQLIREKRELTEKCNVLAQKIREMEAKFQRDLKIAMERQGVELQRAREICMASEKIRRERWLEAKTSKIKEMTVKGLEPELRSMVEQHQQEIQDIRSAHMKELQDVELRTIRRSNQQLEQLRLELTESHDKLAATEREALRARFQEKFDEQETLMQAQQRKYFEDLQNEKRLFSDELGRKKKEHEAVVQSISHEFQEKIAKLMRQSEIEKQNLKEALKAERDAWVENFKRQQITKFEMSEARIRDECDRERDRQIELVIERLEKETRDMKTSMQKCGDNKLRCMKEKYETDLQMSRENEKFTKEKLMKTEQKLENIQIDLEKMETRLGKCLADLNESDRMVEKLTREKDQAKDLARQEIEHEKRELEERIASLYKEITEINSNKESHMAQVYSRVKLIMTQKDVMINKISKEADESRNRCDHLEKLLDQQRKEYVLKSL
ncbi:centrosomal protein of 131 kDa [Diachasma alloeum]|uniref:centrosomal protein of 131 kDa n=1 Tax=Diachasma alloeum TaxID=454923 RepID=UPI0007381138|nr:centrosomal protein of 131 kDa [Diachasma alloeum]